MIEPNVSAAGPKRITLVIGSLGPGGAERNLLRLAEALVRRGHIVSVMTLNSDLKDFYVLPESIARSQPFPDATMSPRWFDVRAQLRKRNALRGSLVNTAPDLVISFVDTCNIEVLLAIGFGSGIPVIVSERNDWRHHPLNLRWRVLRRVLYPLAASMVSLAKAPEIEAKRYWPRWKSCHIPNAVPSIPDAPSERPIWFGPKNVIGMGRLSEQKGFDLLISAFASCAQLHPDWHLTILGEGPKRLELEEQINSLGLSSRIHMPGTQPLPFPILQQADLFVFSSRYEAFGMALAEAMACGLPVISFDCPSGPGDIVRDGIDGVLVPPGDLERLSQEMSMLMGDSVMRARMAERAPEVCIRFAPESILNQWTDLVERVLAKNMENT
jgi:glycosyltransferase involved in cell wall biosynthesis